MQIGLDFDWGTHELFVNGQSVQYGVQDVEEGRSPGAEFNYFGGTEPQSIGQTQVDYTATITVHETVYKQLLANAATPGRIETLQPLVLTWIAATGDGKRSKVIMTVWRIIPGTNSMSQGDTSKTRQLETRAVVQHIPL